MSKDIQTLCYGDRAIKVCCFDADKQNEEFAKLMQFRLNHEKQSHIEPLPVSNAVLLIALLVLAGFFVWCLFRYD